MATKRRPGAAQPIGLLVLLGAVATASACLGQLGLDGLLGTDGGTPVVVGGGGGGGGGVVLSTDLPCDVYALLSTSCWACHGATPANGAPQSLVTPAELAAASPGYPTQSNAQRALVRMASTTAPMPPSGSGYPAPTAAQQAAFASYTDAGLPTQQCISDGGTPPGDDGGTSDGGRDAGTDAGSGGGGGDGGIVVDVPCDIYALLSTYCWACHGPTPTNGAPQPLVTLAELQALSPGYPTQSNGQRAVVRMADSAAPMPPSGNAAPSATDQGNFAAWVDAGMPAGSCTTDGGIPDAGPPDPLNEPAQCTSGVTYTGSEGSNMRPGEACIACHQREGGPGFNIGGTVYPTGHEPDDCVASASAGAVVTVTDSTGATASFTCNGNGNFSGNASLTFPITAVVSFSGKTRAMTTPVASGDCNSCHTQTGANGAPGRVTLPAPY